MASKEMIKNLKKSVIGAGTSEPLLAKYGIDISKSVIAQCQELQVYLVERLVRSAYTARDPLYKPLSLMDVMSEPSEKAKESDLRYRHAQGRLTEQERLNPQTKETLERIQREAIAEAQRTAQFYLEGEAGFLLKCKEAHDAGWEWIKSTGSSETSQIAFDTFMRHEPYFNYEKMSTKEFLNV